MRLGSEEAKEILLKRLQQGETKDFAIAQNMRAFFEKQKGKLG